VVSFGFVAYLALLAGAPCDEPNGAQILSLAPACVEPREQPAVCHPGNRVCCITADRHSRGLRPEMLDLRQFGRPPPATGTGWSAMRRSLSFRCCETGQRNGAVADACRWRNADLPRAHGHGSRFGTQCPVREDGTRTAPDRRERSLTSKATVCCAVHRQLRGHRQPDRGRGATPAAAARSRISALQTARMEESAR